MTLINRAWFRVGSDRYASSARTYGVTTLTKRHVRVRGSRIAYCVRGKHRTLVRSTVADADLAAALKLVATAPGGARLFRYRRNGSLVSLTGPVLNAYLAEHLGNGFTAKDFRTWGGTLAAAIALAEHGPPASESEAKRVLADAMRRVGEQLGNSPTVARSSYVSPQ